MGRRAKHPGTVYQGAGLWLRFSWRLWKKDRALIGFRSCISATLDSLGRLEPFCAEIREDKQKLRESIERLNWRLSEFETAKSAKELDRFNARIKELEQSVRECEQKNSEWTKRFASIDEELRNLRERAGVIPGREFASRTAELVAIASRRPNDARRVKKGGCGKSRRTYAALSDCFFEARNGLTELREHMQTAEMAIRGLPELEAAVRGIAELRPESDVAAAQDYERLLATHTAIERAIANGQYQVANHHLQGARRLGAALEQALQNRFMLARSEVDLWRDDDEICDKFDLESFPQKLTAADAQRWQDIRVEIADIVNQRAGGTFKAYGDAFRRKRSLQLSLDEMKNSDKLEAFARAATRVSKL